MKRVIAAAVGGLVTGAVGVYLYNLYRDKKETAVWNEPFDHAEELLEEKIEPRFELGQRVVMIDPTFGTEFSTPNGQAATFTVEDVKFDEEDGIYRYMLNGNGSTEWFAESWLDFDYNDKMAKHSNEMFPKDDAVSDEKGRKLEIDYWLSHYADAVRQGDVLERERAVDEINRLRGVGSGEK